MPTAVATRADAELDTPGEIAELLHTAVDGDSSAWTEIVVRYGRLVSATVQSYGLQDADTLDAIQMTWLRLLTKYRRIQDPEKLTAWLVTTARRECLAILRRSKRTAFHDERWDVPTDPSDYPEQRFLAGEEVKIIRSLVAELPVRGQILLWALFSNSPLPYSEIASTMGIPIGSLGPTRARTLQKLRRMLDERGLA
jgi:RNA polymerase sigma factor (sigma-70 family)